MTIEDSLKQMIIEQSRNAVPDSLPQGEWSVVSNRHDEATAKLVCEGNLPVAKVIYELRGMFSHKVAIPKSYTIYSTKDLPDGRIETVQRTYNFLDNIPSFFLGGYTIRDKHGKRVEQGTMDETGERHPFPFV